MTCQSATGVPMVPMVPMAAPIMPVAQMGLRFHTPGRRDEDGTVDQDHRNVPLVSVFSIFFFG